MIAIVTSIFALHAACVQIDRWPGIPVTLDETVAEIKDPPAGHAEREAAFVALFKQAGATDADIQIAPLPDTVAPLLEKAKEQLAARLKDGGASQNEIDVAVAALARRHQALGHNVRVVLPGRTDRVIGFAAHLDAAEGSGGVVDNWAACVLISNLYQTLRSTRPQHTIWFMGFAEEELGCLGSASWVDALDRKAIGRIDAMVTVDCAGVAAPMAWWTGSSAGVVELASDAAAQAGVPLQVVDFPGSNSDSLSFKHRSIPVIALLGIDPPHLRLLHGPEDRFEAIDPRHIDETFKLLRTLAAEFDGYAQPLLWDFVKAKLRLGEAGGRKSIRPVKLDLAASLAPLPAAPEATAPPPAEPAKVEPPPRDGSRP